MKTLKRIREYFTRAEICLYLCSVAAVTASFIISGSSGYFGFAASLVGVTSLIFSAKGNPAGQALMVVFSVMYGVISFGFGYYGEMITYLGMTMPMAVWALVSWLKNPFAEKKSEVAINSVSRTEMVLMWVFNVFLTTIFYFILAYFDTSNLILSTVSVATSFAAVYLTARRSEYYAIMYAMNDLVLIVLWTLASLADKSYWSVLVCFAVFFINDLYGFISWRRMKKRQLNTKNEI